MRKIFSHYGLLAMTMIAGLGGIAIFIAVFFKEEISLTSLLYVWISHLLKV